MSKFLNWTMAAALAATAAPVFAGKLGLGRPALPEEIAAWNIDISPDGTGLPVGSGDVFTGDELFAEHCATCHGDFAEGRGNWPKLAGGKGSLADKDPLKTVGSYWPYLSTVYDYVHRSMPFGNAQSLSPDEVYAIVAYILYSNDLVDDEFELSNENFLEVEMTNPDGFFVDDRAETEYAKWRTEPCMENCKDDVKITMRASILDVTPDEEVSDTDTSAATDDAASAPAIAAPAFDAQMAEAGEKVFKKCKSCHQIGDGAKNKSGPMLNGILGRGVGAVEGFRYSKAFKEKADEGMVWGEAELAAFLAGPKKYLKGTKMSFAGLKKDEDIANVIEYLKSFE